VLLRGIYVLIGVVSVVSWYMVYNCVYCCDTCYIPGADGYCEFEDEVYHSCIIKIDTITLYIHTKDAYYCDTCYIPGSYRDSEC
jgi:hypothetical protein